MPNIGRSTGRIDQQGTLIAHHLFCLHRFRICAVRATALVIIRLLGCLRLNNGKAMSNNTLIAVIDHGLWQTLAEIHHHRWIKWRRILKGLQANEELEVGILLDLLNQLFIG